MKFGILDNNCKSENSSKIGIRHQWQYWLAVVPFALQTLVTIGAIEHLAIRNINENTEERANRVSRKANRSIILRLSKYLDESVRISTEPGQLLELNSFLQQLVAEVAEVDEVALVAKDGSVIASSNRQQLAPIGQLIPRAQSDRPTQFTLTIAQQQIVGQIAPLPDNSNQGEWFVVVAGQPKTTVKAIATGNRLRIWYGVYLLPTTLLGLAIYFWLVRNLNNASKERTSTPNTAAATKAVAPERTTNSQISSSLVADMSHELRSPLNAILGFGQIMEHSLTDREQRENLAIINRSGKRLLSIINELVDLSRIEDDRLGLQQRSFDLHAWLDSIEPSIQFQAGEQNIEFSLTRETNLPQYISLDELRLRQILRNLLDFVLGGSQDSAVHLGVGCDFISSQAEPQQRLDIRFEVESTNLAISPTKLAELFNPSIQVNRECPSPQGSSLSLPVSRKLARLMGGDLTVRHRVLESPGTILALNVKAELATDYDLQIQSAPQEIAGLESDQPEYRILIVDDSKTNRQIMMQLLKRVGFKVEEAINGREAVDTWLRWQPHMIWMDLRMPVMDGYEATSQIRSRSLSNRPAIVALSASTSEEERSLFRESGCDDFVGKPFSENIIFDKIAQHLGVRYVYQTATPPTTERFRLTADSLQVMPDSWLDSIEQAAASLDGELLTQLLEEIPAEHSGLSNALQQQVDNFDFDKILDLIKRSKSKST